MCTLIPPTCVPTSTLYTDDNCMAVDGTVVHDGACKIPAGAVQSMKMTSTGAPSGGSCALAGGGALVGSATGTNPVSVCCSN
jgi:hypothetical protein